MLIRSQCQLEVTAPPHKQGEVPFLTHPLSESHLYASPGRHLTLPAPQQDEILLGSIDQYKRTSLCSGHPGGEASEPPV